MADTQAETDRCPFSVTRAGSVTTSDPNAASYLRLTRALAVEMHENWLEAHRYLNMDDVCEHKKEALRMAA
jgi:putative transposase